MFVTFICDGFLVGAGLAIAGSVRDTRREDAQFRHVALHGLPLVVDGGFLMPQAPPEFLEGLGGFAVTSTIIYETTAGGFGDSWWRRQYDQWRTENSNVDLSGAQFYGVDPALQDNMTAVCAQMTAPREPRFYQLLTRAGHPDYTGNDLVTVRALQECWVERNDVRYMLRPVDYYELNHFAPTQRGFPTIFWFNAGTLLLWPTPDAEYRVGFTERTEITRGPNYEELARITRNAFYPCDFSSAYKNQQKSLDLLKTWLTPTQLTQYEKDGTFEVIGCDTGKRYKITDGRFSYGIKELDRKGNVKAAYCFVPEGAYAAGDVMLAQKVALEQNEKAALKIANRQSSWT